MYVSPAAACVPGLALSLWLGCQGRVAPEPTPMGAPVHRRQSGPDGAAVGAAVHTGPWRPAPPGERAPLQLGVWIPHWHRARGARRVRTRIQLFDSVSAFGFRVQPGGRIDDTLRHRRGDWRRLHGAARARGVEILPTLAWSRASDIHRVLSSPRARREHVAAIVKLAERRGYTGVDIDYEGKLLATRSHFSAFLTQLSEALHRRGRVLSCTVEARTSATPPARSKGRALFPWANDLRTLGRVCDRVRIMAYDQWFAEHGATSWTGRTRGPRVPNADRVWVKRVVQHFVRYVDVTKLELGVPTYGWLFGALGQRGEWTYARISALSHQRLLRLKRRFGGRITRTAGGELGLEYKRQGARRVGTVCDAPCVRDRIRLAERLGLRGVVLFKIEGEEDPRLMQVLAQERRRLSGDGEGVAPP